MGRLGMIGIGILILMAIFAPMVAPHDPTKMLTMPKAAPTAEFIFGSDNYVLRRGKLQVPG